MFRSQERITSFSHLLWSDWSEKNVLVTTGNGETNVVVWFFGMIHDRESLEQENRATYSL